MSLTTRPPTPAAAHDLTDAEFAELDTLLAATPAPFEPLDAVMLDGFLCGVIVQPVLLEADTWLPHVFDFEGRPLPDPVDGAWLQRIRALILRRHTALNRALAEDGWIDPLVFDLDDDAAGSGAGPADPVEESGADPDDGLAPISRALMPWVAGFQHAAACFPDLDEVPDEAVMAALARLYRHLPAESDEERDLVATFDREYPLTSLDDAVEDLVADVAELYELTREQRYKVEAVRRDAPKVGRNDVCPCGSGKKYKHCHGAG